MTQNFPSFAEALRVWLRIGLLSFGGPAAQIAVMHREVVEQRHWVSDARFLHALNFCMLLPGPEAQQLATYLGWLMHGVRGGLVAGLLFILPGAAGLLMLGPRYLPAPEVSMITLLEVILGPLLVWAVIGENPGQMSLIGGAVIVVTVALHTLRRVSQPQGGG